MGTGKSAAELVPQASVLAQLRRLLGEGPDIHTGDLPMFMHKGRDSGQGGESSSLAGNKTTRVCLHGDLQFGLGLEVRLLQHLHSAL